MITWLLCFWACGEVERTLCQERVGAERSPLGGQKAEESSLYSRALPPVHGV